MPPKKKIKSGPISYWRIKNDKEGLIWIWCDSKFRVWSKEIDQVQAYLAEFVKPNDKITFVGFTKEEKTIKGSKFLKVYHES